MDKTSRGSAPRKKDWRDWRDILLEHETGQFWEPPPWPKPSQSSVKTVSQSPKPPKNEEQRHGDRWIRRAKILEKRGASLPLQQFNQQGREEARRIWNTNTETSWIGGIPPFGGLEEKQAAETIKRRWIEQGIWKDKWDKMKLGIYMDAGNWKHEEELELESESETDPEGEPGRPPLLLPPRRPKSDGEKRRIAKRLPIREREREASRPYYQFVYQMTKARKQIEDDSPDGDISIAEASPDVNTRAYEIVKNAWIRRSIWNEKWGIIPGMMWMHELDWDERDADTPPPTQADPAVASNQEAAIPRKGIFRAPSPIASDHSQMSAALDSPLKGLFGNADTRTWKNSNYEFEEAFNDFGRKIWIWKPKVDSDERGADTPPPAQADTAIASNQEAAKPRKSIFRAPSSIASDHSQMSAALDSPPKGLFGNADTRTWKNFNPEKLSSLALNSPQLGEPSHEYGQTQPMASTTLCPENPSSMSEATAKRPQVDGAPPRRSKRIRSPTNSQN